MTNTTDADGEHTPITDEILQIIDGPGGTNRYAVALRLTRWHIKAVKAAALRRDELEQAITEPLAGLVACYDTKDGRNKYEELIQTILLWHQGSKPIPARPGKGNNTNGDSLSTVL